MNICLTLIQLRLARVLRVPFLVAGVLVTFGLLPANATIIVNNWSGFWAEATVQWSNSPGQGAQMVLLPPSSTQTFEGYSYLKASSLTLFTNSPVQYPTISGSSVTSNALNAYGVNCFDSFDPPAQVYITGYSIANSAACVFLSPITMSGEFLSGLFYGMSAAAIVATIWMIRRGFKASWGYDS